MAEDGQDEPTAAGDEVAGHREHDEGKRARKDHPLLAAGIAVAPFTFGASLANIPIEMAATSVVAGTSLVVLVKLWIGHPIHACGPLTCADELALGFVGLGDRQFCAGWHDHEVGAGKEVVDVVVVRAVGGN